MDLNRIAYSEPHDDDDVVATLALLHFLMGDSLAQAAARHRLSVTQAETLIRSVLLRHGYAARSARMNRDPP